MGLQADPEQEPGPLPRPTHHRWVQLSPLEAGAHPYVLRQVGPTLKLLVNDFWAFWARPLNLDIRWYGHIAGNYGGAIGAGITFSVRDDLEEPVVRVPCTLTCPRRSSRLRHNLQYSGKAMAADAFAMLTEVSSDGGLIATNDELTRLSDVIKRQALKVPYSGVQL